MTTHLGNGIHTNTAESERPAKPGVCLEQSPEMEHRHGEEENVKYDRAWQ
jgi:hypothetical protein